MKQINWWLRSSRPKQKKNISPMYHIETQNYAGSTGLNACLQPFFGYELVYNASVAACMPARNNGEVSSLDVAFTLYVSARCMI